MSKVVLPIMQIVVVLLLCFCIEAKYMKYKDPTQPLNVRIKDLINRMTLEEKVGQMAMIDREVASADVIKKYFIGNILSGAQSLLAPRAPAETWINMINGFQRSATSTRLGIPILYGIDATHGHNTVYNATIFPHNVGLGVTRSAGTQDGAAVMKATVKTTELLKQWSVG